jgi:PhnB protein
MSKVKAVPEGYRTVTPYLVVRDAAKAIEFYAKAFGAQEIYRMPGPDGKVMHAELQIGDSRLMLAEECPGQSKSPQTLGGTACNIHLYVEDADQLFNRAVSAGAQVRFPVTDMFWGDRYGKLADPFGHEWGIATHQEEVAPEEMANRAAKAMGQSA